MSERARQAYLRHTQLDAATRARLRARLGAGLRPRPRLRDAAARVTSADAEVLERLEARILGARPRRRRWVVGVPLALLAAATVLGLVRLRSDDPPLDPSSPIEHVTLSLEGQGRVGGTRHAPVVTWEQGALGVVVTPGQGVALRVVTPEATASVVGTAFVVDRTHHATRVDVSEGTVRVRCTDGHTTDVGPGEHTTCLPTDAATLLLRTIELDRASGPSEARLETLDRGIALAPGGSVVRAELLAHRVRLLGVLGDPDGALASAEAYLDTGEPGRRAELLSFVARTRFDREACAARPILEDAVAELPPGPEAVLLASCIVDTEPERVAGLLADLSWADPAWRTTAERLVARAAR